MIDLLPETKENIISCLRTDENKIKWKEILSSDEIRILCHKTPKTFFEKKPWRLQILDFFKTILQQTSHLENNNYIINSWFQPIDAFCFCPEQISVISNQWIKNKIKTNIFVSVRIGCTVFYFENNKWAYRSWRFAGEKLLDNPWNLKYTNIKHSAADLDLHRKSIRLMVLDDVLTRIIERNKHHILAFNLEEQIYLDDFIYELKIVDFSLQRQTVCNNNSVSSVIVMGLEKDQLGNSKEGIILKAERKSPLASTQEYPSGEMPQKLHKHTEMFLFEQLFKTLQNDLKPWLQTIHLSENVKTKNKITY